MKKISLIPSVFLLIAASIGAQDSVQPETSPTHRPFSVNVDLVELHVAVVDGTGRPIGGLGQQNFKIKENNILQPITVFKHEDLPVSLGLVVDNSRSIEPRKARLDAAALSFVDKSNPEDETFIIHFDSEVRLSRSFTHDRMSLHHDLAGAKPYGETALYDAIMTGLDTMNEASYSKKALLVITDGIDNRSQSTLEQVVARASRDDVMIFPVGLLSQSGGLKAEDSLIRISYRLYGPARPGCRDRRGLLPELAKRHLMPIFGTPKAWRLDWSTKQMSIIGTTLPQGPKLDIVAR